MQKKGQTKENSFQNAFFGSYFKSDITIIFLLKAGYIHVFCMYFMKILCNVARSRFLATQKKAFRLKQLLKQLEMYSLHFAYTTRKKPYNYFLERKRRRKSLLLQIWIGSKCNLSREEIVLHREQFSVLTQFRYAVKENTVFTNNSKRSHLNFRAGNKCPNLVQFLSNFWREIIC